MCLAGLIWLPLTLLQKHSEFLVSENVIIYLVCKMWMIFNISVDVSNWLSVNIYPVSRTKQPLIPYPNTSIDELISVNVLCITLRLFVSSPYRLIIVSIIKWFQARC